MGTSGRQPGSSGAGITRDELGAQLGGQAPGLLRYARTLVADPHLAEDLVQDTLLVALERSDTFRGDASLATWLHRILHNRAVDTLRRRRELPAEVSNEDAGTRIETLWENDAYTVDPAVVVERAQVRETLQDALLRLPLIYRSAVVLHDDAGLTMPEVAVIQQVGLPAAKQRLRRGRMMLVTELAEQTRPPGPPTVPMRCWDVRSLVSDYLDHELSPRQSALMEQHLGGCPTCPPLYAGLVGLLDALGGRRDPDAVVPPDVADRIAHLVGGG